jgi:hypothetical protein
LKLWKLPRIRILSRQVKCLCLSPRYIGEKGRTLGKTYGIKARCYWEHIGNLMGTHWEVERNIEGTCWEQRKNGINPPPPPPKTSKKNKLRHLGCMLFLFSKLFITIFGLG